MQRTNTPNNINQIPNGGLNINLPQSNLQQGNLQQPIGANSQGNFQQSLNISPNMQLQGISGKPANMQFNKQGFFQLLPGLAVNPSKSQTSSAQCNNPSGQTTQTLQQQNMGAMSQTGFSSNSLAEIAALKGQPSLLSLFASQNTPQLQQNQQTAAPNFNIVQNQLTDAQKQYLVRALQSQSSGQNQPGSNSVQTQYRAVSGNNKPAIVLQGSQGSQLSPQQSQAIVTPIGNQPPYITVQAQPLPSYLQNQLPQMDDEASLLSYILSELQPSASQYAMYPPYPVQQKGSKSSLKTLIPLIINLLKEKNDCGCRHCGCQNNECGVNNVPEPSIFSGYSSQKNYSQGTEETSKKTNDVENPKSKTNVKEQKNDKNNTVNVESEEGRPSSEENDSEYVDDSEED